MYKQVMISVVIFLFFSKLSAQTWSEWFSQNKTQKKYLLQQIAALQVYAGYLQKGYSIAKEGLNFISDFKNGEFSLHNAFFSSLKTVSPAVRNYGKVADIITLQLQIVRQCKKSLNRAKAGGYLKEEELDYVVNVFTRLLAGCADKIDFLLQLITSGKLELKEDERLKLIDNIYKDMQDKYSFVQSFGNNVSLLNTGRAKESFEAKNLKKLYGIE